MIHKNSTKILLRQWAKIAAINVNNNIGRQFRLISNSQNSSTTAQGQMIIPEEFRGFRIESVRRDGEQLSVLWNDGQQGVFPLIWLRDSATDNPNVFHYDETLKARSLNLLNFDLNKTPSDVILNGNGNVKVTWDDNNENEDQSEFSSDWLRFRNPLDSKALNKRKAVYLKEIKTWGAKDIEAVLDSRDYSLLEMLEDDNVLLNVLTDLNEYGIVKIRGPLESGFTKKVEKRLSYATMTHFGLHWSVEIKPNPANLAYTTKRVGLHTDETALQNPPQIMLFHLLRQAKGIGGETEMVDGFNIAQLLKREKPKVYELLSTYPLEFCDEGKDENLDLVWNLVNSHKVIELDYKGDLQQIFFSGHQRGWFFNDLPADKIRDMYEAIKTFNEYCYQPRNLYRKKLQEGEVLMFANNRMLHGRTGFESVVGSSRQMEGCYFDWDVIKSKIRFLRTKLNHPLAQPSF